MNVLPLPRVEDLPARFCVVGVCVELDVQRIDGPSELQCYTCVQPHGQLWLDSAAVEDDDEEPVVAYCTLCLLTSLASRLGPPSSGPIEWWQQCGSRVLAPAVWWRERRAAELRP
jgi:hypothetical protein